MNPVVTINTYFCDQLYCLEHGIQPDGYLTEERKAADPDQGFSTFFSETGKSEVV